MRIGTRGSALALAQARLVAELLGGAEIVVVRTRGDRHMHEHANGRGTNGHVTGQAAAPGTDTLTDPGTPTHPPHEGAPPGTGTPTEAGTPSGTDTPTETGTPSGTDTTSGTGTRERGGDKSQWVAELEQALLAGDVDLAVHSAKDVPGETAAGLALLGAPPRAAVEDALIGARSLEGLPRGARVGTSSVRRAAQLLAARDDLRVMSLRGNVDTRLRKLAEEVSEGSEGSGAGSSLHAIVLASAGLRRLGRERDIGCTLDATRFVPAPGQGALALQARADDAAVSDAVTAILDKDTSACLRAERAVAHALGASCNTPLGAHATAAGCGCLNLRAWIGLPDGSEWIADELLGGFYDPEELGRRVAERLEAVGARGLLRRAEEMAVERI